MSLLNDKRGQIIDEEILTSPGFLMLSALTLSATFIGWYVSRNRDYHFSLLQVGLFMIVEVVICYILAMKMFD